MAEIFKAKTYSHGGFENLVVIKRILDHLGENEEFVEMFIDEAKISVALQHPNIIRIYDFGKLLDNYFIAMECVHGKDVRNILRKLSHQRRFLPLEYAAFIAFEACKGLEYAHRKSDMQGEAFGIVHRDISPSNILVAYEGGVKIADFGIAKAESNSYATQAGVLKGKFEYMSPEQAVGKELDYRSDLFSLGIVMHEMITGRRLFKCDNEMETLQKIRDVAVERPMEANPRVPLELDRIVMKCLARDRDERYQSARQIGDDLRAYLSPSNPDAIRSAAARFMHELFSEEMKGELQRIEEGSRRAVALRESSPLTAETESWTGPPTSSTIGTGGRPRGVIPVLLLGILLLVLSAGLAGAAIVVLGFTTMIDTEEAAPTTGTLDIAVKPAARVTIDGLEVSDSASQISIPGLAPGKHSVVLEAEGYEKLEDQVAIEIGQVTRLKTRLEIVAELVPEPVAPPVVHFVSDPPGAEVWVDTALVGRTPYDWSAGRPDRSYAIELYLTGYSRVKSNLDGLVVGETTEFSRTLQAQKAAPGALTVALLGGGWANVYVDGKKLKTTAPLTGYTLAAGTHKIQVINEPLGIDHTETVVIGGGKTVTVRVRPP